MANRGLPKKYAKMGFKKGWAAYKKSKGGKSTAKKSKSKRKKGKTRRRARSLIKRAQNTSGQGVVSFIDSAVALYEATLPVWQNMSHYSAGTLTGDAVGRNILKAYTGIDIPEDPAAPTTWDIGYAWGLPCIALGIMHKKEQGLVNKYAPIRGLLPGRKQGIASWATSIGAKAASYYPVYRAYNLAKDSGPTYKNAIFTSEMNLQKTGFYISPLMSDKVTWVPDFNELTKGYAGTIGGIVVKKGMSMLTKNVKLKMPRLN